MAEGTSTPTFIDTNRQSLKSRSHFANWTGRTRRFTPYTKTPKSRKSGKCNNKIKKGSKQTNANKQPKKVKTEIKKIVQTRNQLKESFF